jgi:hypothetical protein
MYPKALSIFAALAGHDGACTWRHYAKEFHGQAMSSARAEHRPALHDHTRLPAGGTAVNVGKNEESQRRSMRGRDRARAIRKPGFGTEIRPDERRMRDRCRTSRRLARGHHHHHHHEIHLISDWSTATAMGEVPNLGVRDDARNE